MSIYGVFSMFRLCFLGLVLEGFLGGVLGLLGRGLGVDFVMIFGGCKELLFCVLDLGVFWSLSNIEGELIRRWYVLRLREVSRLDII